MPNKLKGPELLNFVKSNPELDEGELAIEAGYYVSLHGKKCAKRAQFHRSLLAARGIELKHPGAPEREPSCRLTVGSRGQAFLSAAYTKKLGLKPGDTIKAELFMLHGETPQWILSADLPEPEFGDDVKYCMADTSIPFAV